MIRVMDNTLYYGDNLDVLKTHVADESVDLIYLDPPFNSQSDYNVLFHEETGEASQAQVRAFTDTWHWDTSAQRTYQDLIETAPQAIAKMISAFREFIGDSDLLAYLVMMTIRLQELRRVLKPGGSIFLHCDPTASHYLKVAMDATFGKANFKNEIIWKRYSAHGNASTRFGTVHDTILFYGKGVPKTWTPQFGPYDADYVAGFFRHTEERTNRRYRLQNVTNPNKNRPNLTYEWKGHTRVWKWTREKMEELDRAGRLVYSSTGFPQLKQYLDEGRGRALQDVWDDIPSLQSSASERMGYPTQKPLALLERIIIAASNEGDVILDPFCGCGTAVVAAERLARRWIGIDVTHLAISLMKYRLHDGFGLKPGRDFAVVGEPADASGARELARQDRYQFQFWALSLIHARPLEPKKGRDKGVDGTLFFLDGPQASETHSVVIQVKSGKVSPTHIRDLKGVIEREKAAVGLFVTLSTPTKDMRGEAAAAGFYHSSLMGRDYPKVQILTIDELLSGSTFDLPTRPRQIPRARKVSRRPSLELDLDFEAHAS